MHELNEGGSCDEESDQGKHGGHRGRRVHVGTVDHVEGDRIKIKRERQLRSVRGHHHHIEIGFVVGVEGNKVRLSANADIAVTLEEEPSGRPVKLG